MKAVLLFLFFAFALVSSAFASEPTSAPIGNWNGFYAGINGGYGWSDKSDQLACPASGSCPPVPFSGLSPEGGFGGAQVGYNVQGALGYAPLVVGIEADIQGSDIGHNRTDVPRLNDFFTSKLDWFGTVRARIGFAVDNALFYATAGLAFGGIENVAYFGSPLNAARIDHTATGYVVGGGTEYKFDTAWSIKAEYQYINLGQNDPRWTFGGGTYKGDGNVVNDDAFHTVRVGLNYKFN